MSPVTSILSLGLVLAAGSMATPGVAAPAGPQSSQSPMPPPKSDLPKAQTKPAKSITSPSGASTSKRSAQCTAEAAKRGLSENDRKAFRLSCMATAAPVANVGESTQPPAPSKEKSSLGVVKDGRQN